MSWFKRYPPFGRVEPKARGGRIVTDASMITTKPSRGATPKAFDHYPKVLNLGIIAATKLIQSQLD